MAFAICILCTLTARSGAATLATDGLQPCQPAGVAAWDLEAAGTCLQWCGSKFLLVQHSE
jgi:hypothetical protein